MGDDKIDKPDRIFETREPAKASKLIAKKDFNLNCPPRVVKQIKKGDDLSDIPKDIRGTLKTEGVL